MLRAAGVPSHNSASRHLMLSPAAETTHLVPPGTSFPNYLLELQVLRSTCPRHDILGSITTGKMPKTHRVATLLVANRHLQPDTAAAGVSKAMNINAMTPADVQIQRVEHQKAQTLADLESALKRQADLQADIATKHESIGKLHSRAQNLTDLLVQAQYNVTHDLPVIAEQAIPDSKINEQTAIWEEEISRLEKQAQKEENKAVVTGQQIKSTAKEVTAHRHRYHVKTQAAEQLRRLRPESSEAKALKPNKTDQVRSLFFPL
ncbi:hypothetical protein ABBQ38_007886 [Trebouxia sp. C0009 RCD-2024]